MKRMEHGDYKPRMTQMDADESLTAISVLSTVNLA